MKSLKVLDLTLRDGGCVNDFNFGQPYMDKIITALENSGIDIIEVGYIDEKDGSEKGRTKYCNEQVISKYFMKKKKSNVTYVAMIDYAKFNPDNLQPCSQNSIDGIRVAFHKKDRFNMIPFARKIIEKGYKLFIQPMTIMRYSDKELLEFIDLVNSQLSDANAFYIVDSFGEMRMDDMNRVLHLVDHNLIPSMTLGFHSHNNLQLSYSNAVTLLQFPTNRHLILDSSIMGMGKGAGNLNTELFLEHLNMYYGKNYNVSPLLEVIDSVINPIRDEFYWGYSVEYYLSSINHCTPSYAKHFYKKHMLSIDKVAELLSMIKEEKKISFDKEYAEQLYFEYNSSQDYDDSNTINMIKNMVKDKKVLILAPGKNLITAKDKINDLINDSDVISIALNMLDEFDTDFTFITRLDVLEKSKETEKNILVSSSIVEKECNDMNIVNYRKWINFEKGAHDSSGIMILNLLRACGVKEILLAGFDGFSANINDNYFDVTMRRPVTVEDAENRNKYFKHFIMDMEKSVDIKYLTESIYNK